MIPKNLDWAFEAGHRVVTPGGSGKTENRRLANLVLPTGKIAIGSPVNDMINHPNRVQPQVAPGTFPVSISFIHRKDPTGAAGFLGTFAFLAVRFSQAQTTSWETVGQFFTDAGDGCIFDASAVELLKEKRMALEREEWANLKAGALNNGDGNLVLNEKNGANAIVFKTADAVYHCFLGRDDRGNITCLVIDGRIETANAGPVQAFLKLFQKGGRE